MVKISGLLSIPVLMLFYFLYVGLILFITVWLQRSSRLQNWDWTYPLVLGNEVTGDRPWNGSISEIQIADQAFSKSQVSSIFMDQNPAMELEDSLIASYFYKDNINKFSTNGKSPALLWYGDPSNPSATNGFELGPENWLITKGPITEISQALSETSELSIIASVASADLEQYGPARIISISKDTSNRNLTIGQNGGDLIVRFRYPIEGHHAIKPEIIVQDIFNDDLMHRIIITYDSVTLRIFVDGLERSYSVSITPELLFFHWLIGSQTWKLTIDQLDILGYVISFYVIIFVPAGLLLAYLIIAAKKQNKYPRLLICVGVLLPTIVLEITLARERSFKPQYFLISFIVLTLATLMSIWFISSRTSSNSHAQRDQSLIVETEHKQQP